MAGREGEHEDVYGKSFALYDLEELTRFAEFFTQRFAANGLDPRATFGGKRCLDAGCGSGRGSLFMLMNGAASVTAIDVSPTNIETTARQCRAAGFESVACRQTSLEEIPFEEGAFDVVWCNGVVHHTAEPDGCLAEITRVLKVGGQAWIYVYGAGGLYWYLVRHVRRILAGTPSAQLLAILQLAGLPVRYIAEYMDDWKVPYLRAYTEAEFTARLGDAGYRASGPLARGVTSDTSERRTRYPDEHAWYGEGDLRYLVTKRERRPLDGRTLGDSGLDLDHRYAAEVVERFSPLATRLGHLAARDPSLGVLACARVQRSVRDALSTPDRLDVAAIERALRQVLDQLERALPGRHRRSGRGGAPVTGGALSPGSAPPRAGRPTAASIPAP
jgi:ubiquinone/menaquinone biosynthesis C-methylase UbiE